jgi:hypothetical protein
MKQQMNRSEFWRQVDKESGECWLLKRPRTGDHYGHFWWDGQMHMAHRLAWEFEHGPLPKGKRLWRTCPNTMCVRPSHHVLKAGRVEGGREVVERPTLLTLSRKLDELLEMVRRFLPNAAEEGR